MNNCLAWCAAALSVFCFILPIRSTNAATPEDIDFAIARAVEYLKKSQKDGNWEEHSKANFDKLDPKGGPSESSAFGGRTAIATYALLSAGESDQSPELAKAIRWLRNTELLGTYAVALRSQVWLLIPENKERNAARDRDKEFLLTTMLQQGPSIGFYGYSHNPAFWPTKADAWCDRSNSQFAVLGVWALEEAGAEIPQRFWQTVDRAWTGAQKNDGGWNYSDAGPDWSKESINMTCAGMATLLITQDHLLNGSNLEPCRGQTTNENIERALKYIQKHINDALVGVPAGAMVGYNTSYYGLFGVARVGAASGRKYFGDIDWFDVGSRFLISNQKPDGSWSGSFGPLPDTSFALLFLCRGRMPVMFSKLRYESDATAKSGMEFRNERPRDVANLARWASGTMGRAFSWRTIGLNEPQEALDQTPVLFISGSDKFSFSKNEMQRLREFSKRGGLIVGNANCGKEAFRKSFSDFTAKLFPQYVMRPLPATHPIFTQEKFKASKWKQVPEIEGWSDGERELMLLVTNADPSWAWQGGRKSGEALFQLGANIFLYAVEHRPPPRPNQNSPLPPTPVIYPSPIQKQPSPTAAEEAAVSARVQEVYGPYPSDPKGCRVTAKKLFDQAGTGTDGVTTRYVLLRDASALAQTAGDFTLSLKVVEMMGRSFQVDVVPREASILKNPPPGTFTPEKLKELAAAAMVFSRESAASMEFTRAIVAADFAERVSTAANDVLSAKESHALLVSMLAIERDFAPMQPVIEKLRHAPDDPESNDLLGKFLCLQRDDWTTGLSHLAKGRNSALKWAASRELNALNIDDNPNNAGVKLQIADQWWEIADGASEPEASLWRAHSRKCYAIAAPRLTGVSRMLAEKRSAPTK